MFSSPLTRPVRPQPSRRRRALAAAALALVLTAGAAQAAPRRGHAPAKPAGLLQAVYTWFSSLLSPYGVAPASPEAPREEGLQGARTGGTTYDPTVKAGGTMDPDG